MGRKPIETWTNEEDIFLKECVLESISKGGTQAEAFEIVSEKLNRKTSACATRWNSEVKKNCEEELKLAREQRKKLKKEQKVENETLESEGVEQNNEEINVEEEGENKQVREELASKNTENQNIVNEVVEKNKISEQLELIKKLTIDLEKKVVEQPVDLQNEKLKRENEFLENELKVYKGLFRNILGEVCRKEPLKKELIEFLNNESVSKELFSWR